LGEWLSKMPQPFWLIKAALNRGGSISLEPSRLTEAMLTGKGPDPWSFLEAFFWLEETMTPGTPYPSDQLEKEAEARDISLKVLKRAKKALGIIARQVGNRWYCTLPLFTTTTTGATGATGATGYSEPKSMAYEKHTGDPG
jgi:hypothetical protein